VVAPCGGGGDEWETVAPSGPSGVASECLGGAEQLPTVLLFYRPATTTMSPISFTSKETTHHKLTSILTIT